MSRFAMLLFCAAALASCAGPHYTKLAATNADGSRAVAWCQMHQPPIAQPFLDNCMASQGWARQ